MLTNEEINQEIMKNENPAIQKDVNDAFDSDEEIVIEDDEYTSYLEDCKSWNCEPDDQVYYEELPLEKQFLYRFPTNNDDFHNIESPMFTIGKILKDRKVSQTKKSSFRYVGKQNNILCKYLISDKPCPSNCKENHDFKSIAFCDGTCNRITYENNFYMGICNKKHSRESFDNYLLRKGIKLFNKNSLKLEFFKIPEDSVLRTILNMYKKLKYQELEINIIDPYMDINDYYRLYN